MIGDLLMKPTHNLIEQSLHANAPRTPTNGDGFGLGWYTQQPHPGLFRSIRPAWNDNNLRDLAGHIESGLFLAHVRATSAANIQETNCHPFRYNNWLFVHNGQINAFNRIRRNLLMQVAPQYFDNIHGTTDSEIMFHLALSFGLEKDVPRAIQHMVDTVEEEAYGEDIDAGLCMTLGISDGKNIWAFRYGSDDISPTLYLSPGVSQLLEINPEIDGRFGDHAACLVSEPIGNFSNLWEEIPPQSMVIIAGSEPEIVPFMRREIPADYTLV